MPVKASFRTDGVPKGPDRFAGLPCVRLTIGDVRSSAVPTQLKTLLGSCVAVCLYDPAAGMGGMNHISLPGDAPEKDARFGVHAMELLINQLMTMGCNRKRLQAKTFGGGNILSCIKSPIGDRNAHFVLNFLTAEGIPLTAKRLGGPAAMEVAFRTDTGYVLLRTLSTVNSNELEKQQALLRSVSPSAPEDDIVLF